MLKFIIPTYSCLLEFSSEIGVEYLTMTVVRYGS